MREMRDMRERERLTKKWEREENEEREKSRAERRPPAPPTRRFVTLSRQGLGEAGGVRDPAGHRPPSAATVTTWGGAAPTHTRGDSTDRSHCSRSSRQLPHPKIREPPQPRPGRPRHLAHPDRPQGPHAQAKGTRRSAPGGAKTSQDEPRRAKRRNPKHQPRPPSGSPSRLQAPDFARRRRRARQSLSWPAEGGSRRLTANSTTPTCQRWRHLRPVGPHGLRNERPQLGVWLKGVL